MRPHGMHGRIQGGSTQMRATVIVITSCYNPLSVYKPHNGRDELGPDDRIEQLIRRINVIEV